MIGESVVSGPFSMAQPHAWWYLDRDLPPISPMTIRNGARWCVPQFNPRCIFPPNGRQDGKTGSRSTLPGHCHGWTLRMGPLPRCPSDKRWGAGARAGAGAPRWSPAVMPSIIVSPCPCRLCLAVFATTSRLRSTRLRQPPPRCRLSLTSHGPIASSRLNSQSMPAAQPVESGNDLVPLPALLCDRFEWVFQVSYAGFSSTTRVFSNFSVRPRRLTHTALSGEVGT